ncbi:hypothetical protein ZIOFF_041127 [Zingiber officinale]|uniref:K Homology domain-containing protein n=1 Tax=Zingiber officinale TaxID=94328 RepID=A0A8J5KYI9_ZINOF|nr:hypothetical protein ZIOFF_041127 [Zingiber officinale]
MHGPCWWSNEMSKEKGGSEAEESCEGTLGDIGTSFFPKSLPSSLPALSVVMADDFHYSSRPDNKRKFDETEDGGVASPPSRKPSGFSAPIASLSPDGGSGGAAPLEQSYNIVPAPLDGIQLAKQRAQEIAARLFSDAEAKRPRVENGGGSGDSRDAGFGSAASDNTLKPMSQTLSSQIGPTSHPLPSYGYQGSNKKIEIPNGRVGVIIGKSGETIKYLQLQSGAKIQVTRDMDADPNSLTRSVEIVGTSEQISRAEQLINDVLAEADSGASATIASRKFGCVPPGVEQFQMKVPNNKVGMVIGKGGETIKNMQARSGARIQVIPLHLPPGDTSTERTIYIDGTQEQIEIAKQLVNDVTSELEIELVDGQEDELSCLELSFAFENYFNCRIYLRWCSNVGRGCRLAWHWSLEESIGGHSIKFSACGKLVNRVRNPAMTGGYSQHGYNVPRPPTSWGPPGAPPVQQPGYGYMPPGVYPGPPPTYNMPQAPYEGYPPSSGWDQTSSQPQQTAPGTGYDYYNQQSQQQQQSYPQTGRGNVQDGYSSAYNANAQQPGYSQTTTNTQGGYDQQGYGSTLNYGTMAASSQDGSANASGAQGGSTQAPPAQPPLSQPLNHTSYPPQGTTPSGYGQVAPPSYGQPPQAQAPPNSQSLYRQGQAPSAPASYMQSALLQPSCGQSTLPQSVYGQQQSYGVPPHSQSGYGNQQQTPYNNSYASGGNSQTHAYSNDNVAQGPYDTAAVATPSTNAPAP